MNEWKKLKWKYIYLFKYLYLYYRRRIDKPDFRKFFFAFALLNLISRVCIRYLCVCSRERTSVCVLFFNFVICKSLSEYIILKYIWLIFTTKTKVLFLNVDIRLFFFLFNNSFLFYSCLFFLLLFYFPFFFF